MFYPTISPHDPNVVIESSDMSGTYLTRDAGAHWRMINLRGVPRFFVFDPSDPKTIYAKTIGLWRSSDAGATWTLVHPDPKDVTGISMADDHATEEFRTASGNTDTITALAVDPKNSRVLYAAFAGKSGFSVRRSNDAGRTWTQTRRTSARCRRGLRRSSFARSRAPRVPRWKRRRVDCSTASPCRKARRLPRNWLTSPPGSPRTARSLRLRRRLVRCARVARWRQDLGHEEAGRAHTRGCYLAPASRGRVSEFRHRRRQVDPHLRRAQDHRFGRDLEAGVGGEGQPQIAHRR